MAACSDAFRNGQAYVHKSMELIAFAEGLASLLPATTERGNNLNPPIWRIPYINSVVESKEQQ